MFLQSKKFWSINHAGLVIPSWSCEISRFFSRLLVKGQNFHQKAFQNPNLQMISRTNLFAASITIIDQFFFVFQDSKPPEKNIKLEIYDQDIPNIKLICKNDKFSMSVIHIFLVFLLLCCEKKWNIVLVDVGDKSSLICDFSDFVWMRKKNFDLIF